MAAAKPVLAAVSHVVALASLEGRVAFVLVASAVAADAAGACEYPGTEQ